MSSGASEQTNEQMSAAECASEAGSAKQVNKWVVWANEWTDDWVA